MPDRLTANSGAILVRTRFDYPRAPLSTLLVRIGLRFGTLLLLLLAMFATWNTLQLWHAIPTSAVHYGP